MMNISDKVILVDVDGVLLDWIYAFTQWMERHNYEQMSDTDDEYDISIRYGLGKVDKERVVRMFNESAGIRKLPPLRDAIKYVRKLHQDHGYVFRVISSLSLDTYAGHLRTKNLIEMFGPTVFESYVYLDTGADKDEALEKYRDSGCFWIEDKAENAELGIELGLESILVDHTFNQECTVRRAKNWKEIYGIITGN
jgi:FMN phosphatase YigB (HAD superfamily)|tara:strand:- start:1287 stop:1874 length:588 start_codon:yes stop_codon:yes gene_type:complete